MTDAEKEKKRRDKNFQKLCKWFDDAAEMADILLEECRVVKCCQSTPAARCSKDEIGIRNVYDMMLFLSALYQCPQDYEGSPEEQRNDYPELAFGLMAVARMVGEMHRNDNGNPMGW